MVLYFFILYLRRQPQLSLGLTKFKGRALVFGREGEKNPDSSNDHKNCSK